MADFGVAILVLMPERMGQSEIVYPMGIASVVIFSWAVLLLFSDRKPMERRWVLIPTILVVALISFVRTIFSITGDIEFSLTLILFAIGLIVFMAYSYYYAGKYEAN
jgi:hypothetical protein